MAAVTPENRAKMAAREERGKERVRRRARMLRMATQGEASVVYALAVNLRCLRSARGMTQEALANRAGVARSRIAMVEDARMKGPRPVTLDRLARALGMTAAKLLARPLPETCSPSSP